MLSFLSLMNNPVTEVNVSLASIAAIISSNTTNTFPVFVRLESSKLQLFVINQ